MAKQRILGFVKTEWLFVLALVGLLGTSLALRRVPTYTTSDLQILYILFVLFVVTTGLREHRVLERVARRLEKGQGVAFKLVLATFFFSMLVTNDVALLTLVPLTMLLRVHRKDWLVILEALAANAGSALSPFGNPQNLFIYWHYQVPLGQFVQVIAPFAGFFLVVLLLVAWVLHIDGQPTTLEVQSEPLNFSAYFYLAALVVIALTVLRVLPLATGIVVLAYALWKDRASLRVDYALLFTFACFFGFTDNLQIMLATALAHPQHVFLLSAVLSQVISNVPAALLLADFTHQWPALLWGVSVGGFGSLVGSLANLIAYRGYLRETQGQVARFTLRFHLLSYTAFFLGVALYWCLFIA